MKRILSALLAVLCTLALTACGTTPSSSAPPKEESSPESKAQSSQASEPGEEQGSDRETVDLVFYWQGDGKPDNQRVWDKLNELTSAAIQTTATHNLVSWSNTNGIDLIIASGEYHDATYVSAGGYPKRVQQGAFAELTPEFIEEHMPDLNAKIPALA